jgi:hypothetical protein
VIGGIDLSAAHDFDTYRDYPVMLDRSLVLTGYDEAVERVIDIIDSGLAAPFLDTVHNQAEQRQPAEWSVSSKADLWRISVWLHTCKGKQKAFWVPSWSTDLVLRENVLSADTHIHVNAIGWPGNYGIRHIMVLKNNGSRVYLRVLSGAAETGGEILTLSAAVGQNINMADVSMISLLNLMRFASDRFEIQYNGPQATLSTALDEVPTA